VLSQFCRRCKGNYAGISVVFGSYSPMRSTFFFEYGHINALTIVTKTSILAGGSIFVRESHMSDEKLKALSQSHTLHPHPDQVREPLFTSGSPFFDPRDLVQVKYELLRRVQVEGDSVAHATALFALSRPTFYAAQAAWERAGLMGLFPEPTGPRHAHKLTEEILVLLEPRASSMSSTELAAWLREEQHLIVHPRSIERALKRAAKKGGPS
jgi:transposase